MIHDAADVRPAAFLISSLINQSLAHLFMIKLISSPHDQLVFQFFVLQVFVSVSTVVVSS